MKNKVLSLATIPDRHRLSSNPYPRSWLDLNKISPDNDIPTFV